MKLNSRPFIIYRILTIHTSAFCKKNQKKLSENWKNIWWTSELSQKIVLFTVWTHCSYSLNFNTQYHVLHFFLVWKKEIQNNKLERENNSEKQNSQLIILDPLSLNIIFFNKSTSLIIFFARLSLNEVALFTM